MNEEQYYAYQHPSQIRPGYRGMTPPYYNAQMAQAQAPAYIKCRPVVSIEEARAAQIDLDGSLFVFTDIGNKKIYTKQICQDGTASLRVYGLIEDVNAAAPSYVTRDEFNKVINQINEAFTQVSALRSQPTQPEPAPARKQEFKI